MDEAVALAAATGRWTQWEEVVVSSDRGRRLVHYYLRGLGDERELAVVGRERSPRHMWYAVQGRFLRSLAAAAGATAAATEPSPSSAAGAGAEGDAPRKWRSRREVVDWLSSLVSGSSFGSPSVANRLHGNSYDDNDVNFAEVTASKVVSPRENSKDFTWLGTAWHCQKRWKHYKSFCRRGITISVHSFVYIMSEEMKRLIAYVEDLYEDTNAFKMVKVRWFDKVDEVGVPLPMDVDDREIFFSLGRQDLSVECIDGLAAVLSAQHFEKFKSGTKHRYWQPCICRRQIDDDEVKPFDITQLQGYWSQEVLRTMFNAASSLKVRFKLTKSGPSSEVGLKRKRDDFNSDALDHNLKNLYPGYHAEVLSQDSGIRGCWFRCLILKRHKDKVKVRYLDLQDADETGNLEEWVMLTRVAKPDPLGIRLSERPMVRPQRVQDIKSPLMLDVGAIVDAWWHGGWWEGILLQAGNDGRLQVYFPGEKRMAEFGEDDLRYSLEWFGRKWNPLKKREDIASKLSSTTDSEDGVIGKQISQLGVPSPEPERHLEILRFADNSFVSKISHDQKRVLADLTNDLKLDNLKWRPRKRSRRSGSKRQSETSSGSSSQGDMESSSPSGSFAQLSITPDEEICKSTGEQRFMGVPVQVSNLVMSRYSILTEPVSKASLHGRGERRGRLEWKKDHHSCKPGSPRIVGPESDSRELPRQAKKAKVSIRILSNPTSCHHQPLAHPRQTSTSTVPPSVSSGFNLLHRGRGRRQLLCGCSSRESDERQDLLHDGSDEHRLQRVLPEDQESSPPDARSGQPRDRPEAATGERLRRIRAAGRRHQAPQNDQPPRRDTRGQGGRRWSRPRCGRRRRTPALN